jgi:TRAP-type uncharacterized transport system fused permease subunit
MADLLQKISRQMFSIISLCGASGMVVGLIAYTGLGVSFSELLTEISGGSILNLALLVALASTILGMGMPTTPAYIMLVALAVPAMVSLGVLPITAHLFCFYFGTLSMITPPICLAVFAASTLSGAGHLPIAFQAIKLAIAAYLIPFIILYNPSLALIEGNIIQKLTVIAFTTIAVYLISISFEGYAIKNKLKIIERIVLTVIALVLIIPNPEIKSLSLLMMKIAGSILALFFIFSLTIKNKKLLKTQTV